MPGNSRLIFIAALAATSQLYAQLPPATVRKIDDIAAQVLADTATPGTSIAVVKDAKLAYVKAYGNARLDPLTPARPGMRYSIGSVSKQFMAGAILLLVQDGKLSLDDSVGRFLPDLTRANEITIRQLLSHTSGYQDFYPLDYVAPFMLKPVTATEILVQWARKPLDFDPGTRWQYSNTNFVAAGSILEKLTGSSLMEFLDTRIFRPLGITSAIDLAQHPLTVSDAAGYTRFALGPLRPAPPEGLGWLFAAGELAMTARDLALWDISLIEHKLLTPASIGAMMTPVRLRNGAPTSYGLGLGVTDDGDHPKLSHGGAVSGFVSQNTVWLDQGAAVVVLTNVDGSSATGRITNQIAPLLVAEVLDPIGAKELEQARRIFTDLQQGKIDRSLLTSDADAFFTSEVLSDAHTSLRPLGDPTSFRQTSVELRGGMTYRHFEIKCKTRALQLSTFTTSEGKLAQYLIQ
jgi:CubicO group peptidase (beta-lactamase class C family)